MVVASINYIQKHGIFRIQYINSNHSMSYRNYLQISKKTIWYCIFYHKQNLNFKTESLYYLQTNTFLQHKLSTVGSCNTKKWAD